MLKMYIIQKQKKLQNENLNLHPKAFTRDKDVKNKVNTFQQWGGIVCRLARQLIRNFAF